MRAHQRAACADRNECVRLEAAWALGRGCCCTRRTIGALALSASGSERDGRPRECSPRVRAAAAASLDHCLAALAGPVEGAPPPPAVGPKELPKEAGKAPAKLPITPAAYYKDLDKQPMTAVVENARQAIGKSPTAPVQAPRRARPRAACSTSSSPRTTPPASPVWTPLPRVPRRSRCRRRPATAVRRPACSLPPISTPFRLRSRSRFPWVPRLPQVLARPPRRPRHSKRSNRRTALIPAPPPRRPRRSKRSKRRRRRSGRRSRRHSCGHRCSTGAGAATVRCRWRCPPGRRRRFIRRSRRCSMACRTRTASGRRRR